MLKRLSLGALTLGAGLLAQPAFATFHLMQIEQVIGGVNGDTTRQAIQLRMRQSGQNLLGPSRLIAWDATGANPVVIFDFSGNVTNSTAGSRVLVATSNFLAGLTPDAVMTNPIPASYLAGGKLTFETDGTPGANVWWGLAWGTYSGTNTGITTGSGGNDADGIFSPPAFAGPLPSTTQQAVQFGGAANALSTNNAADYALTPGAATFTNNANATGTVPVELMEFKVQ